MFLRELDILSPPITLYYKRKNTHASPISGILTIIECLFIFILVLLYIISYVNRESPTSYSFNRYIDDVRAYSFKDLNFFNYIQITKGRDRIFYEFDINKIEIIGINISIEGFKGLSDLSRISHWIYDKCDNKTNITGIEYLLKNERFYGSACIKKFYNKNKSTYYDIDDKNFEWPIIEHGSSHPNTSFFGTIIKKCQNTSFRLKHFNQCESELEINEYIRSSFISFTTIDHYVDILNYKNPIKKFLVTENSMINSDSYFTNYLNFHPGLVKSYDNLFYDNSVEQISYFFHQNSQILSMNDGSNILASFFIWLQNTQQYYERHYHKLMDAIPHIGGYASATMMIAKFINYLIFRFNLLFDTQELISNVLNKNNSVYENIKKSPSIMKLIKNNNNKKNNENLIIKTFDTGQNNNKRNNTEYSEDGKDENNNIISRRINVINNNNLGEETNRVNKNQEDSQEKIISKKKPNAFEENIKRKSTKSAIRLNLSHIEKKKTFNCYNYFFYLILCKKVNIHIKYYEELRKLIISEESMFHNYFNIYKLLEINQVF